MAKNSSIRDLPPSYVVKSKYQIFEEKVDELEVRLKGKIETASGFADNLTNARKMEQILKFYDTNHTGKLDFKQFFSAMIKFNFVGLNREVEALFSRYDDEATGYMDYKMIAFQLYGLGDKPVFDYDQRQTLYKLKTTIIQGGGASGIYDIIQLIRSLNDGNNHVDRFELERALVESGIDAPIDKLQRLFDAFDPKPGTGFINITNLTTELKRGMILERKNFTRDAFKKYDYDNSGLISPDEIVNNFDPYYLKKVQGGNMSAAEVADRMLSLGNHPSMITYSGFVDFFKCISLSIEDNTFYENLIKNSFVGGMTTTSISSRRVLVFHSDGSREIVEILDEDFDKLDNNSIIERIAEKGVTDIAEVRL